MWSPKGTTLRVIRCPTLQVSQFLFPGQRLDTFLTDHVILKYNTKLLGRWNGTNCIFSKGRTHFSCKILPEIIAQLTE